MVWAENPRFDAFLLWTFLSFQTDEPTNVKKVSNLVGFFFKGVTQLHAAHENISTKYECYKRLMKKGENYPKITFLDA